MTKEEMKAHPSGKENAGRLSFMAKVPAWMKEIRASFKKERVAFAGGMVVVAGTAILVANPAAVGAYGVVAAGVALAFYGDSKRNNGIARRLDVAAKKIGGELGKRIQSFTKTKPSLLQVKPRERDL